MDNKIVEYVNETGETKILRNIVEIGQGGFGVVYKAMLDGFGEVAVKYQSIVSRDHMISALLEYKRAPRLQRYNIVVRKIVIVQSVRDEFPDLDMSSVSVIENLPLNYKILFIYDLAVGIDLFDVIELQRKTRVPFSLSTLKLYAVQLLLGLVEIRDAEVVHRDIKPENIMLHNGHIKYIDFGMICETYGENRCTGIKGTPSYISPALARNRDTSDLDELDLYNSDSYAVGMTIMRLIGKCPFDRVADPITFFKKNSLETT